jgi:hypothetical protein
LRIWTQPIGQDRHRRICRLTTPRGYDAHAAIASPENQTVDAAFLWQTGVTGWPVRDLVLLAWSVVTAILVQLKRHNGYSELRRREALLRGISTGRRARSHAPRWRHRGYGKSQKAMQMR